MDSDKNELNEIEKMGYEIYDLIFENIKLRAKTSPEIGDVLQMIFILIASDLKLGGVPTSEIQKMVLHATRESHVPIPINNLKLAIEQMIEISKFFKMDVISRKDKDGQIESFLIAKPESTREFLELNNIKYFKTQGLVSALGLTILSHEKWQSFYQSESSLQPEKSPKILGD
jgi:hypothetical protein